MTERWKPLHAASAKELDVLMRSLLDRAEKAEAENEALRARERPKWHGEVVGDVVGGGLLVLIVDTEDDAEPPAARLRQLLDGTDE